MTAAKKTGGVPADSGQPEARLDARVAGHSTPGRSRAQRWRRTRLRYVSSQMRHRVLLFPKLPPGADAALSHCR